jgi:hypothetical protein
MPSSLKSKNDGSETDGANSDSKTPLIWRIAKGILQASGPIVLGYWLKQGELPPGIQKLWDAHPTRLLLYVGLFASCGALAYDSWQHKAKSRIWAVIAILVSLVPFGVVGAVVWPRNESVGMGVELGVRRVAGPDGAQREFLADIDARPGDTVEFRVLVMTYDFNPTGHHSGVRIVMRGTPGAVTSAVADALVGPGKFGSSDRAVIHSSSKVRIRLAEPRDLRIRTVDGSVLEAPAPPQRTFKATPLEPPLKTSRQIIFLTQPSLMDEVGAYATIELRFRAKILSA